MSAAKVRTLAIIGHGKMGRLIESLAPDYGFRVAAIIGGADNTGARAIDREGLGDADVAVEFTNATAAAANVLACARAGVPVVSGTTGWDADRANVEIEVLALGGGLLWSPNFSLGVNLFWDIAAHASALVRKVPSLDAHIVETHHVAKKDAPSGTARELARLVNEAIGRDVAVTSVRVGAVPGTHELILDGGGEQIRIVHEARDRRIFAEGALAAARWLCGRRGIYTIRDVLDATTPSD
jgi:4-hydroxy-tetrahydrodipicolinate reductase